MHIICILNTWRGGEGMRARKNGQAEGNRQRARPGDSASAGGRAAEPAGEEQHKLGMLLRSAYFALRRCSNAHCAAWQSSGDQFVLLKLLADEEGVTQQDLVARGGYDAATTGTMLRLLEQRSLVERRPDPHDGRAKRVHLTAHGRRLQRDLWQHSEKLRAALQASVPARQRAAFIKTLEQIVRAMDDVRTEYEMESGRRGTR